MQEASEGRHPIPRGCVWEDSVRGCGRTLQLFCYVSRKVFFIIMYQMFSKVPPPISAAGRHSRIPPGRRRRRPVNQGGRDQQRQETTSQTCRGGQLIQYIIIPATTAWASIWRRTKDSTARRGAGGPSAPGPPMETTGSKNHWIHWDLAAMTPAASRCPSLTSKNSQ